MFLGGGGGVRFQPPTRLAPFAGAGAYIGSTPALIGLKTLEAILESETSLATPEQEEREFIMAIYPEAGAHLWLTSDVRLTGFVRYLWTSSENKRGFLNFGVTVGVLFGD